jgi:hypothetical protein
MVVCSAVRYAIIINLNHIFVWEKINTSFLIMGNGLFEELGTTELQQLSEHKNKQESKHEELLFASNQR